MRVFVTGGTGHVGRFVCRELVARQHSLEIVDQRFDREAPGRVHVLNLCDPTQLYGAMEGCDAVVHLANHSHRGAASAQRLYGENVAMNMNVFQSAVDLGVRHIIFASSVQAISGVGDDTDSERVRHLSYLPIDSDTPLCPRNPYALSKAAGEQQLRYFSCLHPERACTALRLPSVMHPDHISYHRQLVNAKKTGDADEGFSYLLATDVARLVEAVLRTGRSGFSVFMPAAADNLRGLSMRDLVATYYAGLPLKKPVEELTSAVDLEFIRRTYGWSPSAPLFAGQA